MALSPFRRFGPLHRRLIRLYFGALIVALAMYFIFTYVGEDSQMSLSKAFAMLFVGVAGLVVIYFYVMFAAFRLGRNLRWWLGPKLYESEARERAEEEEEERRLSR